MPLTNSQIQQFKIDGYLLIPDLLDSNIIKELRTVTKEHLAKRIAPLELEVDVNYPDAPSSKDALGGDTVRRLKAAYQRDKSFADMAKHSHVTSAIQQILQCQSVLLNPNHHNCVMTKQPAYSSKTLWHRDTRYWNFTNKYLINAWFALGDEQEKNGAMKILPGSHRWDVEDEALDEAQFLKTGHTDNIERLATERLITMNAGDVLLFSAHCFHSAGKNTTQEPKYSLVFTYHSENTKPIANTSSALKEEITVYSL